MKLIKLYFIYDGSNPLRCALQCSPSGLANNNEFHLKYKIMSAGIIVGIIFLVITIICLIFRLCIWVFMMFIALIFGITGIVETIEETNMANSGYIINIDNKRNIEVIKRNGNYIQYVDDGDTLVVSKSVWINQVLINPKIVNIKDF